MIWLHVSKTSKPNIENKRQAEHFTSTNPFKTAEPDIKMASQYPVYLLRFKLSLSDPDMPSPRYHTALFVATETTNTEKETETGYTHEVTGDITCPQGMQYIKTRAQIPETTESFFSKEFLGHTDAATYLGGSWDRVLRNLPRPPQQKAFNRATMRTEPFRSLEPLVFYNSGEERRPLWKCTEWTLELAVPALRGVEFIR